MAKTGKQDPSAIVAMPAGATHTSGRVSEPPRTRRHKGLPVPRRVTREGSTASEVLDEVEWTHRPAKISGADGEVVFKMAAAEVPAAFSQLATAAAVSKYSRKAALPAGTSPSGSETSVRQLVRRVAHTLRTAGEEMGG